MGIACQPGYPRLSLLRRSDAADGTLQTGDRLTALGRDAVYWAFHGMRYPAGTSAWMPSFHCGVEVQAALDAGLTVEYYRIAPDLSADANDLERGLARRPGPVLLIHYFGFPQPHARQVLEVCRRHGVPLIEDCCHALFSASADGRLGSLGSLATFSVRKSLGTIDGGLLRIDARRYQEHAGRPFESPPDGPRAGWPYRALARRALRARFGSLPAALEQRLCAGVPDPDLCPEDLGDGTPSRHARSSRLAERVLRTARPGDIVSRRRANWASLRGMLGDLPGCRQVHADIPAGACPLGLVLSTHRRDAVVRAVRAAGVEPYVFGAEPHRTLDRSRFPEAGSLRQDLVCLPVHQGLRPVEVDQVAMQFRTAVRNASRA